MDKNISKNKPFVTAKKFIFWKKEKKKRKRFWGKCKLSLMSQPIETSFEAQNKILSASYIGQYLEGHLKPLEPKESFKDNHLVYTKLENIKGMQFANFILILNLVNFKVQWRFTLNKSSNT